MAESVLSNLNRYRGLLPNGDLPPTNEIKLDIDLPREEFMHKLRELSQLWGDWEDLRAPVRRTA